MNKKEIWKTFPLNEMYHVSSYGKVFNNNKKKYIKVGLGKNGYYRGMLYINGKRKTMMLHRIIAFTFINNKYEKEYVNHKDGNKKNNQIDNLEWVTHKENMEHAFWTGLSKRTVVYVYNKKDGKFLFSTVSIRESEKRTGVARAHIIECLKNKISYSKDFIFSEGKEEKVEPIKTPKYCLFENGKIIKKFDSHKQAYNNTRFTCNQVKGGLDRNSKKEIKDIKSKFFWKIMYE